MRHRDFQSRLAIALSGRGHTRTARAIDFIAERYLLLPAGAVLALVWANTLPDSYFRVALSLAFPVNDVLMAFFFALITQEIVERCCRAARSIAGGSGSCRSPPRPAGSPAPRSSTSRTSA